MNEQWQGMKRQRTQLTRIVTVMLRNEQDLKCNEQVMNSNERGMQLAQKP